MYIIILKSLIYEFKHSPFINAENRLKLLINFNNSQKIFESNNKKMILKLKNFNYVKNYNREKNMAINALFLLENIDKIFVQSPRRNDENINNIENIIDLMKENLVKFKLNTTALKQRTKL